MSPERCGVYRLSNNAVGRLLELLFQLSIIFNTEYFTNGQPSSTLLVCFSGVLGFSSDARDFLLPPLPFSLLDIHRFSSSRPHLDLYRCHPYHRYPNRRPR